MYHEAKIFKLPHSLLKCTIVFWLYMYKEIILFSNGVCNGGDGRVIGYDFVREQQHMHNFVDQTQNLVSWKKMKS